MSERKPASRTRIVVAVALFSAWVAADKVNLSPFVRSGRLQEARDAARVELPASVLVPGSGAAEIEMYAGYFEVGTPTADCKVKQIFAWFVPAQKPTKPLSEAGVLLWEQGGPGASGVFGFLAENGALEVAPNTTLLQPRQWSWSLEQGGLWIDQPLGTGFSTIESVACLKNTSAEAAADVVDLLDQWAAMFPEAASGPFRIFGESYGGTYAPATAFALVNADAQRYPHAAALGKNLDAVVMGDPWALPLVQMPKYPALVQGFSIADERQAQQLSEMFDQATANASQGTLEGRLEAFKLWNSFWGDYNPTGFTSGFEEMSGCSDTLNVIRCQFPAAIGAYGPLLHNPEVLEALHVGKDAHAGANSSLVYRQFAEVSGDFMVGVRKEVEALLSSGIRMMVYHGAVDGICGAATGDALVYSLRWQGAEDFAAASRVTWKVDATDETSAGWVVESDKTNLAWVVLRDAGHLVPFDQPRSAWAMMDRFVNHKPIASA